MNRRGFLKLFSGAAAAAAAPTYFLPPIGGWKSDVIRRPSFYHTYLAGNDALVSHHYDLIVCDDLVATGSTAMLIQLLGSERMQEYLRLEGLRVDYAAVLSYTGIADELIKQS